MKRRTFTGALAGATLLPIRAYAEPQERRFRVGILRPASLLSNDAVIAALQQLGYTSGQNIVFDEQVAEQDLSSLPLLARKLVQPKPDLIFTIGSAATRAARDATSTVPIVFLGNFDPVSAGVVASLARPGGNVTGVLISSEGTFAAKKMEFLKEVVVDARRIAILVPDDPIAQSQVEEARRAAPALGVQLLVVEARNGRYVEAFSKIAAEQADALLVGAHTYFVRDRLPIIGLAAKHRLPAIYEWPDQVRDGGLMSYGPNREKLYFRVAFYIDRILKGENPSSLPVELPTLIELVLNLRTAKAMGLSFPTTLLSRADELVE